MPLKGITIATFLGCLVIAVGITTGLWLHGNANIVAQQNKSISVTGSSRTPVEADLARWMLNIDLKSYDNPDALAGAYNGINEKKKRLLSLVEEKGISKDEITFMPIQNMQWYDNFTAQQMINVTLSVRVESNKIDVIEELSQDQQLTQDILPSFSSVEYYYTKLAELRPTAIAEAAKDAKVRAEALAEVSNVKVGNLQTLKTGVIQVLPPNSVDVNDYGAYDLSTKKKEVMATVQATFDIR